MPKFTASTFAQAQETIQPPIGLGNVPLKSATVTTPSGDEQEELLQIAAEILQDPVAMQYLCDRVYTLLQQDIQRQRERSGGYGRRW
ncbi:hypothetical protein ACQ4M4_18255 [Leptolyngbya sp. AN02str]|uniref:hypothetical protein n=1 Tax=Leptolyngbya sp. AN02str TaxID=3423363 RepID=UPI003D31124D